MKTSSDPRHLARKLAVATVFAVITAEDVKLSLDEVVETSTEALEIKEYDQGLFSKITTDFDALINQSKDWISKSSNDWNIEKIFKTDLAILIVAVCELINKTAPIKVVIDEAVELAKEFGQEDSPKFVNGVLAGVVREHFSHDN